MATEELPQNTLAPEKRSVQGDFAVMSFKVGGVKLAFACLHDDAEGGNRIVRFPRPYRDGEKLDDTGAEARVWTPIAVFGNDVKEPGLDPAIPVYPDLMARVLRLFATHETGDLVTPHDGVVRARAHKWKRVTPEDFVDYAAVHLTFIEDSEDSVGAEQFSRPGVSGRNQILADETRFSLELEDNWSDVILEVQVLASELEGLMRAPGRAVEDAQARTRSLAHSLERVIATAQEVTGLSRAEGTSPPAPAAEIRLHQLLDLAAAAAAERQSTAPERIPYVVKQPTSIFYIASRVKQPVEALLDLNWKIEDPFYVRPGVYQIYKTWP